MSARETVVAPATVAAGAAPEVLAAVGVGSCVVIALYDAAARVGGLAHVMLPAPSLGRGEAQTGRYPQTAIPLLLERMAALGAQPGRLTARLVGGASMFAALNPPGVIKMGERNLVATRQALAAHAIPVTGEATGGQHGRAVRLDTSDGRLAIDSVHQGAAQL